MRVVELWNRLSRELVEPSSLETLKTWLDAILGQPIVDSEQSYTVWRGHFQPQPFCHSVADRTILSGVSPVLIFRRCGSLLLEVIFHTLIDG